MDLFENFFSILHRFSDELNARINWSKCTRARVSRTRHTRPHQTYDNRKLVWDNPRNFNILLFVIFYKNLCFFLCFRLDQPVTNSSSAMDSKKVNNNRHDFSSYLISRFSASGSNFGIQSSHPIFGLPKKAARSYRRTLRANLLRPLKLPHEPTYT